MQSPVVIGYTAKRIALEVIDSGGESKKDNTPGNAVTTGKETVPTPTKKPQKEKGLLHRLFS